MRADRLRNVLFAANLQTRCERDSVLDCLSCAVARCWKIWVGTVTNLHNSGSRRRPSGLRVSPQEFEVDNRVRRGASNKVLEDWRPFLGSWDLIQALDDFVSFDCVTPGLCLATGRLHSRQCIILYPVSGGIQAALHHDLQSRSFGPDVSE